MRVCSSATKKKHTPDGMKHHPLASPWTWYLHKEGSDGYKSTLAVAGSCETIESFWRLKNNIPSFQKAFARHTILLVEKSPVTGMSFFRGTVTPEWEHAQNVNGVIMECKGSFDAKAVDEMFLAQLMKLVGNVAPVSCNGIRVVHKNGRKSFYKIEMWYRAGSTAADQAFFDCSSFKFRRCHA